MSTKDKKHIPWMLYHKSGVFFRYERNEKIKELQLTHAVIPINYDELFLFIERVYTKLEKYANRPYFTIKRCLSRKADEIPLVKIYFMTDEGIKYMGWYKSSIFDNRHLFKCLKLTSKKLYYGHKNTGIASYDSSQIYILMNKNVNNFCNY